MDGDKSKVASGAAWIIGKGFQGFAPLSGPPCDNLR
jgi:hypothetical protein